jgi:hypothetical protein
LHNLRKRCPSSHEQGDRLNPNQPEEGAGKPTTIQVILSWHSLYRRAIPFCGRAGLYWLTTRERIRLMQNDPLGPEPAGRLAAFPGRAA